jgi:CBS domain-containing protein
MPTVQDILNVKGDIVHATGPQATVLEATRKMNQHKLGALIVRSREGQVLGIFTERDVLRRVIGELRDPATTLVEEVMTTEVICCPRHTDIDEASAIMKEKRIRHLPVCDEDGGLVGMVSIGDLNAFHASEQQAQIMFLNDYIYGRV